MAVARGLLYTLAIPRLNRGTRVLDVAVLVSCGRESQWFNEKCEASVMLVGLRIKPGE